MYLVSFWLAGLDSAKRSLTQSVSVALESFYQSKVRVVCVYVLTGMFSRGIHTEVCRENLDRRR